MERNIGEMEMTKRHPAREKKKKSQSALRTNLTRRVVRRFNDTPHSSSAKKQEWVGGRRLSLENRLLEKKVRAQKGRQNEYSKGGMMEEG